MPESKSGTGVVVHGEDAQLIAAENNRVTFVGPPDIMQPVRIVSIQEEPLTNDVVFTLPNDTLFASWSVELTGPDGTPQFYGPFAGAIGRVAGKPLLAGRESAEFTARIIGQNSDGVQRASGTRGFRLQSAIDEEVAADRYSILFEFDDSRTVQTYERFLTETVAPAIPHASVVVVHGHTDQIGDVDHNAKLSQSRAAETQKVLSNELRKQGKFVTFDTYGFGEDEQRAPFNNTNPEHRYYNRTVVIEVVQGE
jgi:outer membrane protein OmpA-like peptidoglycan-associated protein